MNKKNLNMINALPLTEVMRGWNHVPHGDREKTASYLCPWHDDHHPSLIVDKVVRDGAKDLGFKCFRCGQEGFGAIQLAARLMGFERGPVPTERVEEVVTEIVTRCSVELPEEESERRHYDNLRTSIVGWGEFCKQEPANADMADGEARFDRGEWTEEGLKALGLKVELAQRKIKKSEYAEHPEYSGSPEIRVGDLLTQRDPDTGEALYRCSFGKDFYRGAQKAETRTIAAWGEEVERTFGVQPVARFLKRIRPEGGGAAVRIVKATKNYPIFIFQYPWGIKKYEPKDIYGNKWTWFNVADDADLYHQWYADAMLTNALVGGVVEQDVRHPYEEVSDKDGKSNGKVRFERVVLCSGPRDAIAVWSHSNAHVVWLHSEQAGFDRKNGNVRPNRWLRGFIKKLLGVTAEGGLYVCYDEDAVGLASSRAIALNNPQVRWLRLPKELGQILSSAKNKQGIQKPLKDVTDFITHFSEVEGRMAAEVQHDDPVEWMDNALYDTPTCQWWQWESERKDADGTGRARYKFDLRNTPVFLRARGMVRKVVQGEDETFSRFFLLGNDNTYTELFPGAKGSSRLVSMARELMSEWLRAHKEYNDEKGSLSRAIFSAKLEQATMESIETQEIDDKSYGEDFDHFFFANCAVRVTADEIKTVPYNQMKQLTNSEAILPGTFTVQPQAWHVVVNPIYEAERAKHEEILCNALTPEERAQENMRWDSWSSLWHYLLKTDKPLEEMPVHYRFLYNTCRVFWEKEQSTGELTKTEQQMQDANMIAMLHALGSALVRHRSANRQQFIHVTDNGTRREDLASGGTGKTAILELLGLVRRVLSIDGKALEGSNIVLEQELGKIVPGIHNIVAIDELPAGFSPKKMYNLPLSVTSRGLYKGSVVLRGDDLPKFIVASNETLDLSSDSTSRRIYQVLVSDWYHPKSIDGSRPAHTPADDFRKPYGIKEVARNLPASILNDARNLLIGCTQLFLSMPDETLRPPKDSRAMLRQALASSKDEEFTRWIAGYLMDKRHIGIPIAKRELAISLLDYCGIAVGEKSLTAAHNRIKNNLEDYLRSSMFVVDPPIVFKTETDKQKRARCTPAWLTPLNKDKTPQTDADGNRLPRELDKSKPALVYYFYRKGRVPFHGFDASGAHDGDPDYVQAAPETDPDRDKE